MAHAFGNTDVEDGVTGSSLKGRGLAGNSTDQAGTVGFSKNFVGVWGENQSGHAAVFGKSAVGVGVHGESTDQVGTKGISAKFVGVWGENQSGHPGVFGKSAVGVGVHGESTDQVGVRGISAKFVGVWGESSSENHPGVFGKGKKLAGGFVGDVYVSGELTVNGLPVSALVRRINELEAAVRELQKRADIPHPSLSPPSLNISARGNGVFAVSGSGYKPASAITVRVVDNALKTITQQVSSNQDGKISEQTIRLVCVIGAPLHFSATDGRSNPSDLTGVLWSNTVTTACA
jgi:hypothetical protein